MSRARCGRPNPAFPLPRPPPGRTTSTPPLQLFVMCKKNPKVGFAACQRPHFTHLQPGASVRWARRREKQVALSRAKPHAAPAASPPRPYSPQHKQRQLFSTAAAAQQPATQPLTALQYLAGGVADLSQLACPHWGTALPQQHRCVRERLARGWLRQLLVIALLPLCPGRSLVFVRLL
jgi:hypothetical protein